MAKSKSRLRKFFALVWESDIHGLASEISFTFLLTLFPLLVVFVSLLGLIQDPKTINLITDQLGKVLPQPIFQPIEKSVENLTNVKDYKIIALSLLISFASSLSIFGAVIKSLRSISFITEKIGFIKAQWMSLRMMLVSGILIVIYFYVSYGLYLFEKYLYSSFKFTLFRKNPEIFLAVITFFVVTSLFSFYYSYATSRRTSILKSLPGAIFAALLWIPLTFGFQYYLKLKNVGVNYALAYYLLSKMVVLMLYAYINSTFFLWGYAWNQTRNDIGKETK
ncbi:MAG: YhjD/YihY/BrkB family envelope integrity protein [Leptospira sp.]|nr:YhjD/YihY/BrkB family envelope integrity protein [Leptospira sp.]